jgi:hypothetical protein
MEKTYIDGGPSAYLIPIHIGKASNPTVSDSTTQTALKPGEIVYIDKPVVVDKGVYFALISKKL